jgi:hypothetical protein
MKDEELSDNSEDVGARQTDLTGGLVDGSKDEELLPREEVQLLKSVLQKAIRRGRVEQAMYVARRLSTKKTGYILWRRLSIISVEDVLDPAIIVAVEILRRQAGGFGYESWDGKRCAVAAALLMAESKKDRRTDEFLELMEVAEKDSEKIPEFDGLLQELKETPDEALDMHTNEGRRMGRGEEFWLEVSSETSDKTEAYQRWREWWKPLMLKATKCA